MWLRRRLQAGLSDDDLIHFQAAVPVIYSFYHVGHFTEHFMHARDVTNSRTDLISPKAKSTKSSYFRLVRPAHYFSRQDYKQALC